MKLALLLFAVAVKTSSALRIFAAMKSLRRFVDPSMAMIPAVLETVSVMVVSILCWLVDSTIQLLLPYFARLSPKNSVVVSILLHLNAISSMTLATSSLTYVTRGPITHAAKLVLVARSSLILWVPVQ